MLTGFNEISHALLRLNLAGYDLLQKVLRIRSRHHGRKALPLLVLVRVGVIADTADHEARKMVHQACRLHLETEDTLLRDQLVSKSRVLGQLISARDKTVVNSGVFIVVFVALFALDKTRGIAVLFAPCRRRGVGGLRRDGRVYRLPHQVFDTSCSF